MNYYARHLSLKEFGESEQARIQSAKVLIVGCGGLGNLAAMYLTTAGVGKLCINDFDSVDESNLQRQILFRTSDIGHNKAAIAQQKLADMNPDCELTFIDKRLSLEALLELTQDTDLILDCTDNFASRLNINHASQKNNIALISGAAIRFEGQLSVFDPAVEDSPCYQCLHQNAEAGLEDCAGNGILAPVTGIIASSMAVEAIKHLSSIGQTLVGRLQLYDARHAHWREIKIRKDPDCACCGSSSD
ncbi:MAG: HesA/MoeB/ThiF family protein [Gammaproteobacteria bacterium]|nr:HesA/MoeB/ThiF family protein [Gammaproteobacteria bacterium]NNM14391.1 HesA/MoeB/ThiF family protein [Gammaproteobacteria bacterium]